MPNDHYIGVLVALFIALGMFAGAAWLFTSLAARENRRDRGEREPYKSPWYADKEKVPGRYENKDVLEVVWEDGDHG